MELLTGKAKEAFLNYYWEKEIKPLKFSICKRADLESFFDTVVELYQTALIIDFFDSVGFYINAELDYLHLIWFPTINSNWEFDEIEYQSREEATIAGIKKANEILNNKLKTSHLQ